MTPDIIIKDNAHLLELHAAGTLSDALIQVPSFKENEEPILINLSSNLRFQNTNASVLIEHLEQNYINAFKKALIDLSLESYYNFRTNKSRSRSFTLMSATGNKALDAWLTSYADRSPIKNRKSLRGYILSLAEDEVEDEIVKVVDELITFESWADAITEEALAKLDINLFPALLLSRKRAISKLGCGYIAEQILWCIEQLNDVKGKKTENDFISILGNADNLLIFSDEHLTETNRRKSSLYRNIYLKLLSYGTVTKSWLPAYSKKTPRLQFRTLASKDLDNAIDQAFSSDRKSILTSLWSRFILCTSIGQTLNFPIQIRLLCGYLFPKDRVRRLGYRKIMEQLTLSVGLRYPLDMCDTIYKQQDSNSSLNWYERYVVVERDSVISVESISDLPSGVIAQPLPDEWREALAIYHELKLTSDGYKSDIMYFVKWAIQYRGALSPWDIKPIDVYTPSPFAHTSECYFDYINNAQGVKSKKTKRNRWGLAKDFYRRVANTLKLKDKNVESPFKNLPKVDFTGRGRRSKTPRARITSIVIDKMAEILCGFDSKGVPTYQWAEQISLTAFNSDRSRGRTDHFFDLESQQYVFCPSRAASLAFLLLLPIRGVQARWLDQGYFDQEIFDPTTKSFKENLSPLKHFESEYHRKQWDVNGGAVGVLQRPSNRLMSGDSDFSIYINTNKTQMWSPDEKNGYEIPWPYISSPEHTYEKNLNHPYNVLFEQLRWLERYSADAQPLRFDHIPSDRERITNARNIMANIPFILPVFRDLTETVSYKLSGKQIIAHPPISKNKIERIFDELCLETEKQLRQEGLDVTLTDTDGKSIFDIHTLRVAGISHLLDIGVPLHIVSEFIAGHASIFMTLGYSKAESDVIKERILQANESTKYVPSASDKVLLGQDNKKLFAPNDHSSDIDLNHRNIATFAPVEGGMCPLGGKGCAGCSEGMPHPEEDNVFVPVQGGCGNCRFWLTGFDFLIEQIMELNRIMFVLKESSKEIQYLNECAEEIEWALEDAETPEERRRLNVKITSTQSSIKGIEESLIPLMKAWKNRYLAVLQSEELRETHDTESGNKPALIGDVNITANLKSGSEYQLIHTIVEQAYLLPKGSVPIPENPARALREFLDTIVSHLDSSFLFARIKDKHLANKGALKLADYLNEHFSQGEIAALSDGRLMEISQLKLEKVTKAANLLQSMIDQQLTLPKNQKSLTHHTLEESI